jgi:hypothetical protein
MVLFFVCYSSTKGDGPGKAQNQQQIYEELAQLLSASLAADMNTQVSH